ncbi:hypothetical protein DE146DRAFT_757330 [Phaeosphaeria sp. MPI-PUGE-AT-0046c]|nr:hypothetical protein DE146DRAFT_757330 [Phaeosphaeria sp. MPI-PUGE-AT-0046c]
MFSTKAVPLRALPRALCQARYPTARRLYATDYEQRTKDTLKTSSRLTWLTTTAAIGAGVVYYATSSPTSSAADPPSDKPKHRHDPGSEDPKPVEDRHGNSVEKHSIAAHKNQNKVREGKFSGKEFDNHLQAHSPGNPGGDFEKK